MHNELKLIAKIKYGTEREREGERKRGKTNWTELSQKTERVKALAGQKEDSWRQEKNY